MNFAIRCYSIYRIYVSLKIRNFFLYKNAYCIWGVYMQKEHYWTILRQGSGKSTAGERISSPLQFIIPGSKFRQFAENLLLPLVPFSLYLDRNNGSGHHHWDHGWCLLRWTRRDLVVDQCDPPAQPH